MVSFLYKSISLIEHYLSPNLIDEKTKALNQQISEEKNWEFFDDGINTLKNIFIYISFCFTRLL